MAYITEAGVTQYFAATASAAEWAALSAAEKTAAREQATILLEAIPFVTDTFPRAARRYNEMAALSPELTIAFCELALWTTKNNTQTQATVSNLAGGTVTLSGYIAQFPAVVQNALTRYVDDSPRRLRGQDKSASAGGGIQYAFESDTPPIVSVDEVRRVISELLPKGVNPYQFDYLLKDVAAPNINAQGFDNRIADNGDGITLPFMPQTSFAGESVIRNRAFITQPEGFVNFELTATTATQYEVIVVTTHIAAMNGQDIVTRERRARREVVVGIQEIPLASFQSTVKLDSAAAAGLTTPAPPVKMEVVINLYNQQGRVIGTLSQLAYNKCGVHFWQLSDNSGQPGRDGVDGRDGSDGAPGQPGPPGPAGSGGGNVHKYITTASFGDSRAKAAGDFIVIENGAEAGLYALESAVAPNSPWSSLAVNAARRIDRDGLATVAALQQATSSAAINAIIAAWVAANPNNFNQIHGKAIPPFPTS